MNNKLADKLSGDSKTDFQIKLNALAEPFEVEDVYWLPQSIVTGNKAVAAAYANKRVYTERLDEVLGAECWQIEIDPPITTDYIKTVREKRAVWNDPNSAILVPASQEKNFKVMIKARCGVWVEYMDQWVWKSSTGVAESADENSVTTAEAQAVKRAISMWGPGNYFYSLGTQIVPYDTKSKKFTVTPTLPEWAMPVHKCTDCSKAITSFTFANPDQSIQSFTAAEVRKIGQAKYSTNLCVDCQKIRKTAQATK
jgi:hypothetical protein